MRTRSERHPGGSQGPGAVTPSKAGVQCMDVLDTGFRRYDAGTASAGMTAPKFVLLVFLSPCLALAASDISKGVAAFDQRRWAEAMEEFLEVLRDDPTNARAHAYVDLIARTLETERLAALREERLEVLGQASKQLEESRLDSSSVLQAILDTTQAEQRAQEEKWRTRCEEARLQRDLGHLPAANDLILQVLLENASFGEAQRELSEIQSQIRQTLDSGNAPSIVERYTLEGFYAYGQADYASALTAWRKARALLEQSDAASEAANRLEALRFGPYEKIAQAHVDEDHRLAELKDLFDRGVALYQEHHSSQALEEFRKLAIRDPEYPQLGYYLVQAEAAAEKERTARLGEEKRREIEEGLQRGLAALEQEAYPQAEERFQKVLALDPSHPQALSYLAMVRAEMQRRQDPKAAQLHYEAGLIAYASGKLDEARREWSVASRMNPQNEKALNALAKVKKELALYREEL
jgi:hypothetical protein